MSANEMKAGERVKIVSLSLDQQEKRRLMDMGFVPGAVLERLLEAPLGGTTAFRIRGTVVALRDDQTKRIEVAPCKN